MKLHDQQVIIGDTAYDLLEGEGQVIVDGNTEISVVFGNGRTYRYNSSGNRVGNTPHRFPPLLYWQNPIVMIPVKDDTKWEAMKGLLFSAHKIINKV